MRGMEAQLSRRGWEIPEPVRLQFSPAIMVLDVIWHFTCLFWSGLPILSSQFLHISFFPSEELLTLPAMMPESRLWTGVKLKRAQTRSVLSVYQDVICRTCFVPEGFL